jgi:menaquinol-cytochrome c reductase iron-sulfur subunit
MPDETPLNELSPDRRRLAVTAICGFIGTICAGLGLPSLAYLLSPPKSQSQQQWVDVGDLGDFEPGTPRAVTFRCNRTDGWVVDSGKERAWVVTEADGKIKAFSPWCTHLGCAYNWDGARRQFLCPCHNSRFALDGTRTAGPAPRGLDQYEVRREGRRLWLRTAARQEATRS